MEWSAGHYFVAAIQRNVDQGSKHERHSDYQRTGLHRGFASINGWMPRPIIAPASAEQNRQHAPSSRAGVFDAFIPQIARAILLCLDARPSLPRLVVRVRVVRLPNAAEGRYFLVSQVATP